MGYIPEGGVAGLYDNAMFHSEETAKLFSTEAAPFYAPISNAQGFQFLHTLINTCNFFPFFFFLFWILAILVVVVGDFVVVLICIFLMIS